MRKHGGKLQIPNQWEVRTAVEFSENDHHFPALQYVSRVKHLRVKTFSIDVV